MLERDGYPCGVPCWIDTSQPDPEAAAAFYGGLFGWECEERTAAGSSERYFMARLRGLDVAGIGPQPEGAPTAPVWNTYVWVESAEEAVALAIDAGGRVLMGPTDVGEAGRMAVLADRSGAAFSVWQAKEHRGARRVNEPGTWTSSSLNTRDQAGAEAFYGAVFGWNTSTLDGADLGFWRVDGYSDHLEERAPGMRQRMADMGAPEGFEDAVAWLSPMTEDQFPDGAPPHWSVTFAVDDADAAADQAAKLGGQVLVAPFDAPWVRMAVLSDPQGTVFTASQFVPPT